MVISVNHQLAVGVPDSVDVAQPLSVIQSALTIAQASTVIVEVHDLSGIAEDKADDTVDVIIPKGGGDAAGIRLLRDVSILVVNELG